MEISMLLEKLKLDAGEQVFHQAVSLYQSGDIKNYNLTRQGSSRFQIKALVKAAGVYGVNLTIEYNNGQMKIDQYCTCSADNNLCEHAAAVAYKFLADDFPKVSPGSVKPVKLPSLDPIESLKLAAGGIAGESPLSYKAGNLDNNAEIFTLTLFIPSQNPPWVTQLVEALGDINYSARKREQAFGSLTGFDRLVVSYIENHMSGKDAGTGTVSLPKIKENFQLIMTLIETGRAFHGNTSRRLVLGETLQPRVFLAGDETRLTFTYDISEFEFTGFLNRDFNYIADNDTIRVIDISAAQKLPAEVIVPPERLGEVLFEILPRLAENVQLETDSGFGSHQLILHEPEILLPFDYEQEQIVCRPEIQLDQRLYRGEDCLRLITDTPRYERSEDDPKQWFAVNRQPLKELLKFLEQNHFEYGPAGWVISGPIDSLKFRMTGLQQIPGTWKVNQGAGFETLEIVPAELKPVVMVDMDEAIDWFGFEVLFNLGGATYTHREILSMLRRTDSGGFIKAGERWYYIGSSAAIDLFENAFPDHRAPKAAAKEKCYYLMEFRQLLLEHGIEIKGNAIFDRFEADISGRSLIEARPVPVIPQGELRPYQKEGFYWLWFLHQYRFGGILADDMGLGKTLQVLALIKSIEKQGPVLVVCPRSLIYNWAAEIDKFFPETRHLVYHGSPEAREKLRGLFPDQEIVITTYDMVVNDIDVLQGYAFEYCILDEAQHIKNTQTQRAKECKRINARHRLVMTGTPVENRLEDLWSLFDFLMPGFLGNQHQFKEKYGGGSSKKANSGEALNSLRQKIAPFMLRRQKETVLPELPPKVVIQWNVLMSQLQEDIYRTVLEQVKQDVMNAVNNAGLAKSRMTVLSALTKLRQVCDHPSLALDDISAGVDSGKIDALLELIQEAMDGGHRIVLYSQFVRMLKLIRSKLQEARINYVYLDGSTTDRMERINCFNNTPEIPIFLISLKAGGVGINLTSADIVIHTDPWWNPMVEEQASDRVHRMGQQKQVMVYKLITMGTVEEKLVKLQSRKKAVFDAIVQSNDELVNQLTWEDIRELLEIS
jgi:superfamily II DNA or RNA helicase